MAVPDHNRELDPSLERHFRGHRGKVTDLSFNCTTTQLVSCSSDTTLMLWSLKKSTRPTRFTNISDSVNGVQFAPSGKLMVACSKDKSIWLLKPSVKSVCKSFRGHTSAVRSIHFSPDGTILLTASNDKTVKTWLSQFQNKFISSFPGHTHWVNCARFSHSGHLIVSCSEDKTVKLWDPLSSCCTSTIQDSEVPKYVEFHPNNKCIGICFSDGSIKIYDVRNCDQPLQYYKAHADCVNQMSFHPGGVFLITGSTDKTVKVYDLIEGRVIYTVEGHDGSVSAVTFSQDGKFFASGGADSKVFLWQSNFDNEVLAKPLDTTSNLKENKEDTGVKQPPRVDARLSLSLIEQPDMEVNIAQTETSESSEESKNQNSEESIATCTSVTSAEITSLPRGNNREEDELAELKKVVAALEVDVKNILNQLMNVKDAVAVLEKRKTDNKTISQISRDLALL